MKKLVVFCAAMMAMTVSSFAQQPVDSVKIAVPVDSVQVAPVDSVMVAQPVEEEEETCKGATKFNISVDLGGYTSFSKFPGQDYMIPDRDDALLADITITYNVTPNFELGIASGCYAPTADNGINVPVLGVLLYRWYVGDDGKWQPFLRVRAGYAFTVNGKGASFGMADIAPGIAFQFASWAAVRASLDVNSFFAQTIKTNKAQFNFAPRIGIEFKF